MYVIVGSLEFPISKPLQIFPQMSDPASYEVSGRFAIVFCVSRMEPLVLVFRCGDLPMPTNVTTALFA